MSSQQQQQQQQPAARHQPEKLQAAAADAAAAPAVQSDESDDSDDSEDSSMTTSEYKALLGKYYASINDVWEAKSYTIHKDESVLFGYLRRSKVPQMLERRRATATAADNRDQNEYIDAINAIDNENCVVADENDSSSRGSFDTLDEDTIWPVDIFGKVHNVVSNAQIVTLIPAEGYAATVASLFTDVARCILAIQDHEDDPLADRDELLLQKSIHGVVVAAQPAAGTNPKRLSHTGIKHFVSNRLRLSNPVFFGTKPWILIIPVLTIDETKAWDGQGYPAIVISKSDHADQIYRNIEMTEIGATATAGQVELARSLLSQVVQGMFYSLKYRQGIVERGMNDATKKRLHELRRTFEKSNSILVPVPLAGPTSLDATYNPNAPTMVRLIAFADHESTTDGHPAPDPMLLAFRAAINWSWQNKQELLKAAVEPPELEDDLYRLAEEEYLAAREQRALERQEREIVGMSINVESQSHDDGSSQES